jgi:hypothetical protein
LYIVPGDTTLVRNIQALFPGFVPVSDTIDKGYEHVDTRFERCPELAKAFNDTSLPHRYDEYQVI